MTEEQFQCAFEVAADQARLNDSIRAHTVAIQRERDRYRDIAQRLVAHGRAALTTQDEVIPWLKACEDLLEINSRFK